MLCCKCKHIVHIIELSCMFKIGKMKVDNLLVFTHLEVSTICNFNMWVYHTKCIKRVGGFPKKIMVLVATLGIDVAPYIFLL